jgi:hypothetical protein
LTAFLNLKENKRGKSNEGRKGGRVKNEKGKQERFAVFGICLDRSEVCRDNGYID